MIKSFMIRYLQRHGYLVLQNHVPMLLISGNAVATHFDKNRTTWQVQFPVKPYLVLLNNSVAT